ncbi:ubiquitin-conjugating enzyme [Hesseltinella vesiculosa]|uniref:Ubiquitin-conjugating enzyme n=1 Tax=Hesseltinella vesiculosa TaxID=101127 RepID=A0A1X2GLN0_9FUNG|nr:ubiquitin-conjugating enzyme [Hesseltinella vesiculosa]
MDSVSRRLLKELKEYSKVDPSHPEITYIGPADDDNLMEWTAHLKGLSGTPYEGGTFELFIKVPSHYPMQPPTISFVTTVCHPNVHIKTGEICLDILKTDWSPAWTLKSAVLAISLLLSNPEPNSPLNCDAANLLKCDDTLGYESLVRMYTSLHAIKE